VAQIISPQSESTATQAATT